MYTTYKVARAHVRFPYRLLLASVGSANDTCSKRYKFISPGLSNRPFIQEQNVNRDV